MKLARKCATRIFRSVCISKSRCNVLFPLCHLYTEYCIRRAEVTLFD